MAEGSGGLPPCSLFTLFDFQVPHKVKGKGIDGPQFTLVCHSCQTGNEVPPLLFCLLLHWYQFLLDFMEGAVVQWP